MSSILSILYSTSTKLVDFTCDSCDNASALDVSGAEGNLRLGNVGAESDETRGGGPAPRTKPFPFTCSQLQ